MRPARKRCCLAWFLLFKTPLPLVSQRLPVSGDVCWLKLFRHVQRAYLEAAARRAESPQSGTFRSHCPAQVGGKSKYQCHVTLKSSSLVRSVSVSESGAMTSSTSLYCLCLLLAYYKQNSTSVNKTGFTSLTTRAAQLHNVLTPHSLLS